MDRSHFVSTWSSVLLSPCTCDLPGLLASVLAVKPALTSVKEELPDEAASDANASGMTSDFCSIHDLFSHSDGPIDYAAAAAGAYTADDTGKDAVTADADADAASASDGKPTAALDGQQQQPANSNSNPITTVTTTSTTSAAGDSMYGGHQGLRDVIDRLLGGRVGGSTGNDACCPCS